MRALCLNWGSTGVAGNARITVVFQPFTVKTVQLPCPRGTRPILFAHLHPATFFLPTCPLSHARCPPHRCAPPAPLPTPLRAALHRCAPTPTRRTAARTAPRTAVPLPFRPPLPTALRPGPAPLCPHPHPTHCCTHRPPYRCAPAPPSPAPHRPAPRPCTAVPLPLLDAPLHAPPSRPPGGLVAWALVGADRKPDGLGSLPNAQGRVQWRGWWLFIAPMGLDSSSGGWR